MAFRNLGKVTIQQLAEHIEQCAPDDLFGFDIVPQQRNIFDRIMAPTIVCLCGPSRFKREFFESNARESREGKIILSIEVFDASDDECSMIFTVARLIFQMKSCS